MASRQPTVTDTPVAPMAPAASAAAPEAITVPTPVVERADLRKPESGESGAVRGRKTGSASGTESESEVTAKLPKPPVPPVPSGAADETAVLPPVRPGAADETAVLPPVRPGAADETAVLPPVEPGGSDTAPADRLPRGYFRDERPAGAGADGSDDRTRELPQIDDAAAAETPRRRQRPDWAEETPLDDLPSLADELLGPRGDDDPDDDLGRGRGRGRRG